MTATSGAAYPDRNRLLTTWGHYSLIGDPYTYPLLIGALIIEWWAPLGLLTAIISVITTAAVVVLIVGTMWPQRAHDRNLCLRCLNASPLLDPQGAVDRHRPKLALFHNRRRGGLLLAAGLLPLGVALVTGVRNLDFGWKIVATAAAVAGTFAMVHTSRCALLHRRLHPWCPWCPHGRGDHDHPAVQPQPQPTGTAN